MNLLNVTLGFPPASSWGGPVLNSYRVCKELVNRGHTVTVYCTNLLDKRTKVEQRTCERVLDGIRVIYFNTWNLPWWPGTLGPFWTPDIVPTIQQEIREYDAVHLHGYRSLMFIPVVRAARRQGVPLITQPHGTLPIQISSFWLKRTYDRLLGGEELKGIHTLIALQESEKRQAVAFGIPPERIEIIPNGIDPMEKANFPEPGSFRKRFSISPDQKVVLFVGRINRIKGIDMLVEAFSRLNHKDTLLVIAGPDNGALVEVQSLVQKYDLGQRVLFTGLLNTSEVYGAFQDSDLFALSSRFEAFPTIVIEACLAEIPMVVTDCCGITSLIKDRVAEVVPFDAQAFAQSIDFLFANPQRMLELKHNCAKVLSDTFSIHAVVDRLEQVYQRATRDAPEKTKK
jgi:glycosyltransferase involved in cell wall biosynthesis